MMIQEHEGLKPDPKDLEKMDEEIFTQPTRVNSDYRGPIEAMRKNVLNHTFHNPPKVIWKLRMFGDIHSPCFNVYKEVSWFRRICTKVLFGSTWTRVNESSSN